MCVCVCVCSFVAGTTPADASGLSVKPAARIEGKSEGDICSKRLINKMC